MKIGDLVCLEHKLLPEMSKYGIVLTEGYTYDTSNEVLIDILIAGEIRTYYECLLQVVQER